jgi:hypothetical protein
VEGPAHARPRPGSGLADEMRALVEPWQQGKRGTRETLAALRDLANRAL